MLWSKLLYGYIFTKWTRTILHRFLLSIRQKIHIFRTMLVIIRTILDYWVVSPTILVRTTTTISTVSTIRDYPTDFHHIKTLLSTYLGTIITRQTMDGCRTIRSQRPHIRGRTVVQFPDLTTRVVRTAGVPLPTGSPRAPPTLGTTPAPARTPRAWKTRILRVIWCSRSTWRVTTVHSLRIRSHQRHFTPGWELSVGICSSFCFV